MKPFLNIVEEERNEDNEVTDESYEWFESATNFLWDECLQQLIYNCLKKMLNTLSASSLQLVKLEIGNQAPKIKKIVTYNSSKTFIIDLEVDMELSIDLHFAWHLFKFGLNSVSLKCVWRIKCLKIYECEKEARLFRQLQFTFKDHPCIIDYKFEGAAEFLNYLKPLVQIVFKSLFVYPNVINIELFPKKERKNT